jgi:hypothetical protein
LTTRATAPWRSVTRSPEQARPSPACAYQFRAGPHFWRSLSAWPRDEERAGAVAHFSNPSQPRRRPGHASQKGGHPTSVGSRDPSGDGVRLFAATRRPEGRRSVLRVWPMSHGRRRAGSWAGPSTMRVPTGLQQPLNKQTSVAAVNDLDPVWPRLRGDPSAARVWPTADWPARYGHIQRLASGSSSDRLRMTRLFDGQLHQGKRACRHRDYCGARRPDTGARMTYVPDRLSSCSVVTSHRML